MKTIQQLQGELKRAEAHYNFMLEVAGAAKAKIIVLKQRIEEQKGGKNGTAV